MAGLPEYAGIRRELYDDCSGVFLVYDVTDNASFKRLNWWIEELENHGR